MKELEKNDFRKYIKIHGTIGNHEICTFPLKLTKKYISIFDF